MAAGQRGKASHAAAYMLLTSSHAPRSRPDPTGRGLGRGTDGRVLYRQRPGEPTEASGAQACTDIAHDQPRPARPGYIWLLSAGAVLPSGGEEVDSTWRRVGPDENTHDWFSDKCGWNRCIVTK